MTFSATKFNIIHLLLNSEGDMKICSTKKIHVAQGDMNFLGWTNLHISFQTELLIVYLYRKLKH